MCLFQHPLKSQCWEAVPAPLVHGGAVERGGVAGLARLRRRNRTGLKIRCWDRRKRGDVSKPVVTQACSRRCVSFPAVSNRTRCANTRAESTLSMPRMRSRALDAVRATPRYLSTVGSGGAIPATLLCINMACRVLAMT